MMIFFIFQSSVCQCSLNSIVFVNGFSYYGILRNMIGYFLSIRKSKSCQPFFSILYFLFLFLRKDPMSQFSREKYYEYYDDEEEEEYEDYNEEEELDEELLNDDIPLTDEDLEMIRQICEAIEESNTDKINSVLKGKVLKLP